LILKLDQAVTAWVKPSTRKIPSKISLMVINQRSGKQVKTEYLWEQAALTIISSKKLSIMS
jgi:hypothetical protein